MDQLPDRAEILKIAADSQTDPRVVLDELEHPGLVRTHARERIRRAIAQRKLSSYLPESTREELRAKLPALQRLQHACLSALNAHDAPDEGVPLPKSAPFDPERAAVFRTFYAQAQERRSQLLELIPAMPELGFMLEQTDEILKIFGRAVARIDRLEAAEKKRQNKTTKQL